MQPPTSWKQCATARSEQTRKSRAILKRDAGLPTLVCMHSGVENKPTNKRGRAHARSARRAAGPALAGGMPDCLRHLLKPLVRLLPPLKLNPSDPRPQD